MTETFIVLFVILGIVAVASFIFKNDMTKMGAAIVVAAALGALVAGMGIRIRELVEGPFAYLDSVLAVMTGMLFAIILVENGTFELLLNKIITKKRNPMIQSLLLILLIALPGIFTGTAIASILTTGVMVGKYLINKGKDKAQVVQFVAVSSLLGLILPPICLPAMIVVVSRSGSYPAAFEGYTIPLLVAALPALLAYANMSAKQIGEFEIDNIETKISIKSLIPLIIVGLLLFSHNFLFRFMPFLGYPLIFTIGTILAILLPFKKINILNSLGKGINYIAPIVAIVFAIASALEILTLTGVSGTLATIYYTVNPALFTIVSMILIIIGGILIGGPFAALVAVICSYVVGALAWGGTELALTAISVALCVAVFLSIRGGLIHNTAAILGVETIDSKKVARGSILPVGLILVIGLIYAAAYSSLVFLVI
ncbi:MAG: hypothetical protein RIN55_05240 [Tissierellaceae bacterium]|nr:hypothetical protein [Tissierellaceae bacterium]